MRSAAFVVPGRLGRLTGGSIYNRRMVEGLRARGWSVDVRELDDSFPQPSAEAIGHADRVLACLDDGAIVVVDGLVLGVLPSIVQREASRLRIVALVHMLLALDVGLDAHRARSLEASERRALAAVAHLVVTGRSTIDVIEGYGVSRDRITLVEPGTDPAPLARGGSEAPTDARDRAFLLARGCDNAADRMALLADEADDVRLRLLCVATIGPGKGHELLIRALASIDSVDWSLTCVGDVTRYPETVARVRAVCRETGLDGRVFLTGERGATLLDWCYSRADLFVLATLRETYGMAVAEALAHGLPVVSTTTGAIPDLVGTEAGLLVPPGDGQAFADALSRVMTDEDLRARLAAGARGVRERLETWDMAASRLAAVLERVAFNE